VAIFLSNKFERMDELRSEMAALLVSQNACSSEEEAEVIAEIVLEFDDDNNDGGGTNGDYFSSVQESLVENLVDNIGIEESEAQNIYLEFKRRNGCLGGDDEESSSSHSEGSIDADESASLTDDNFEGDGNEEEYLVDGECELCDRYIKLTKHHLIPKSTWPRMQTKLLRAAEANENGDREKAVIILGHGLEEILGDADGNQTRSRFLLSSDKAVIREILHDTCNICRQCHTTVHRTHANMELALYYSSVDKLLEDERISKFCKWASKQKTGKYNRGKQ